MEYSPGKNGYTAYRDDYTIAVWSTDKEFPKTILMIVRCPDGTTYEVDTTVYDPGISSFHLSIDDDPLINLPVPWVMVPEDKTDRWPLTVVRE